MTISETVKVWRVFEEFHGQGKVKHLGISNIYDLQSLMQLYEQARVKPSVVQNRFYASSGYDVDIRQFCLQHGVTYQSFWTLTANPHLLRSAPIQAYAGEHKVTHQQAFFRYTMDIGITPLTGTTDELHMKQDLQVAELPSLSPDYVKAINKLLLQSH
uniref:NADP-dependent oxidoreductase domain-containing protein n=1 Tax=Ditylenchus dipsaci TaxID=166011 RepID=A0A915CTH0_9BILA